VEATGETNTMVFFMAPTMALVMLTGGLEQV
jgi:hypothetical protein